MAHPGDRRADDALLAAAASDPDAFTHFYRRHAHGVFAYFLARARRSDLAADLTAEVFAAALDAARSGRHAEHAVAWLYGIARHKLLDSLRKGQVEDAARRRLGWLPLEVSDAALERAEALVDVEREAARLRQLLADLPAEQRDALEARIVDEDEYAEIAARLGCSEALVRQRVSRGLRRLRAAMGEGH